MCRCSIALVLALGLVAPAAAVDVVIDYTYDSSNFFGSGNPDGAAAGAEARAAMEAAAQYLSDRLTDTLSAVETPPDYVGQLSTQSWTWNITFSNPGGGGNVTLVDPTIAVDEYRIYVGAQSLPGSEVGFGGPGGWGWSGSTDGPGYFPDELAEVQAISDAFGAAVSNREETTGYANWGGAVSFDSSFDRWHYDHTASVPGNDVDFFGVALHELTHTLGFGISNVVEWTSLLNGTQFRGSEAFSANGGSFPAVEPDGGHWDEGIQNTVFGGTTSQEVIMDEQSPNGERLFWTDLDAAALRDIGWSTLEIPVDEGLVGDYNDDNVVDAADYTIWRDSFENPNVPVIGSYAGWSGNYGATASTATSVPEPAAATLLGLGLLALCKRR